MDEQSSIPPVPPEPPPPFVPPTPPPPPSALPLPWEQTGYPFFPAVYETCKLFLTRPSEAYARVSPTVSVWRPFLFGCLLAFVMNFFSSFYQALLRTVTGRGMSSWLGRDLGENTIPAFAAFTISVLVSPFLIPIGLALGAGLIHVALLLLGGAKSGYSATLRSASYSYAPAFVGIVPFCGALVGGIWSVVLMVIGLSVLHHVSRGKAVAAVLLPCLLFCACLLPFLFIAGLRGLLPH
jgi:hypothetical protein